MDFDATYTDFRTTIFSAPEPIHKMLVSNSLLLMQSNITGNMYFFNIYALSMGNVGGTIPKN